LALKSIWDVKHHLRNGELVQVLQDYMHEEGSSVQLLFPGGGRPSQRIRVLIDYLAESVRQYDGDVRFEG